MHSKVVIIGSGPAAHTAAIYLARAEMKPVMYEGFVANGIAAGGQLTTTTDVENFPGFPDGIMGQKLMDGMREQSEKAGTTIITETVSKLDVSSKPFKYETEWSPGEVHTADAIILATGASARRMGLPGEDTYWQRGISACAVCDGAAFIFRNGRLVVIGGGDSAAEEALYLTKYASQVLVLVRRDKLRASSIMAQRLAKHPKVEILYTSHALQIDGPNDDGNMARIEIQIGPATKLSDKLRDEFKKNDTWKDEKKGFISAQGLFYAIGHEPATALVKGQLDTDSEGYIITKPGTPLTSVEGVFAAGDVQDKKYRQAITSAGSGCMAALDAEKYLAELELDGREGPAQGKI